LQDGAEAVVTAILLRATQIAGNRIEVRYVAGETGVMQLVAKKCTALMAIGKTGVRPDLW